MLEHKLISLLSTLNPSSQFLAIKNYQNGLEERSDYSVLFNISYHKAVQKSLQILPELKFSSFKKEKLLSNKEEFESARQELIHSYFSSFQGQSLATHTHAYHPIYGYAGKILKGCKLHESTRLIHLYGFVVHRVVLIPAEKKKVNHAPKTIAKNWLRYQLPVSKFVQFRLEPGKYDSLSLAKITFLSEEIPALSLREENSLLRLALSLQE